MSFEYRDLVGNYEKDFPNIKEMFQALAVGTTMENMEGPIITHQFTTTANEIIDHTLQKVPEKFIPTLLEGANGTVLFVSATTNKITLKASDALIKLSFYLE